MSLLRFPARSRAILPLAAALLFAACSGDSDAAAEPDTTTIATDGAPVPIASTTFAPTLEVDLAASTETPTGLYYRDITVGDGAVVEEGDSAAVYYALNLPDGTKIEDTAVGHPYTFIVGRSSVIQGWHEGVEGMRIGGKRQLIIPPTLGYGARDNGPIPGNSVLVFTIEVVDAG